jgi:hypothetical protein
MSRLAIDWIQRSFSVPQIASIERDLADGYILLKILTQMGYVTDEEVETLPPRSANPSVILENFKQLTKYIKRINITLTKRMVTQIMAEESGIAAELIMKMKRGMETMNNPKANLEPEYKKSLKSLRPRQFERYDYYKDIVDTPTTELFYRDASTTLYNGIFNEIDMRCQLGEYEQYKYDVDKKAIQDERKERELEVERKQKVHKDINEFERTIREKNITNNTEVIEKWRKSLKPGEARHIRDLQFELATLKVRELKENKQRNLHRTEGVHGINEFEFNLTRLGIGGGDENANLTTTYESAANFLDRIEEMTTKNLPSNAVIQDFVTQLKVRTKEKKLARYDKARRRRRMLVDQANAQAEASSHNEEGDVGGHGNNVLVNERMIKMKLKEEKELAAVAANSENAKRIKEEAEESVRLFAEQFRMMADESADERLLQVRTIQENIAQRRARKHEGIYNFCGEIVVEMVASMFDAMSADFADPRASYSSIPFGTDGCVELIDKLLQNLDNRVAGSADSADEVRITKLDSWPAFAALALNLNKWKASTVYTTVPVAPVALSTELLVEPIVDAESAVAPADAAVDVAPTETISSIELAKTMSFIESTCHVIEDILSSSREKSEDTTKAFNENLSLSSDETVQLHEQVTGNMCKVMYVVNSSGGWSNPHQCCAQLTHWSNQHQPTIALWDSICAYEACIKIKPLLEGKVPAINFNSLVNIFGRSSYITDSGISFATNEELAVPDAVLGTSLPPKILVLLKEMVETVSRINAIKDSFIGSISSISPTFNYQFTEITLAILLGQSLYIRNYIRGVYTAADAVSIVPPIVVVSNAITSEIPIVGPLDNVSGYIEVLDWFLRGGAKDNAPEHLATLIAEESGAPAPAAGKKKAPAKGAVEEEVPTRSYIAGIILIKSTAVLEDSRVVSLESPLAAASAGYLLLQSYLQRKRGTITNSADDGAIHSLVQKENYMHGITRLYVLNNEVNATDLTYVPVDLAVAELMLCCLLDASQSVADGVSSTLSVKNIQAFRRNNKLSPVSKLLLLHDLGTNPLNMLSLYDIYAVLCSARAEEIEIKGSLLVLLTTQLKILENGILHREEALVASMKQAEEGYKHLCEGTIGEITGLKEMGVKDKLMDLVCNIGDVIDKKHRQWLDLTSELVKAANDELFAAQILMLKLVEVTGEVAFKVLESHKNVGLQLASSLEIAGYDEFPWLVDPAGTNRLVVDAKRDDLRAVVSTVCQDIELLYTNADASERRLMHQETESASDKSVVWTTLASLPTTAAEVNAVRSTVISSVYNDTLEFALTWNSTIHLLLQDVIASITASNERLKRYVTTRHSYKHRVLSQWSKELLSFNFNDVVSISDFLKVSSFSVSYDHKIDGIRVMSKGNNLVDLSDMKLPLAMISELSQELSQRIDSDVEAQHTSYLSATIIDIIKAKIEQSEEYYRMTPVVWRDAAKVDQFVSCVLNRSVMSSSSSDTRRSFHKSFIVTLLAGLCPVLPSKEYLLRIGKVLSPPTLDELPLSFQQKPSLPIDLFLAKLLDDKVVNKGWFSPVNSSELKLLFTVIASCCLVKSTNEVVIEEFLLMLCKDTTAVESKILENSTGLVRASGNDDDPNAINISNKPSDSVLAAMPLYLNNGLCKLAYLAAHMRFDESLPCKSGVVSKDYHRLKEVMGDQKLSQKQLEWLLSKLDCKDTPATSTRIMAEKSHRIFGLSNGEDSSAAMTPQEFIAKNSEIYISELLQDKYIGSKSVQQKLILSQSPTHEGLGV